VAEALKSYGFEVKLITNPTAREIKKELAEMAFVIGKEKTGLFFSISPGMERRLPWRMGPSSATSFHQTAPSGTGTPYHSITLPFP
jgi:hypothetical protein